MADIDKSLPNITDPKRPSPEVLEEIDVGAMEEKGPIEVTPKTMAAQRLILMRTQDLRFQELKSISII